MPVAALTWTLTPAQLYVLWNDLGLADFPYPLDVVEPTTVEPEGIAAELAAAGLLEDGQPKPALDDALRLLAQRQVWVDSIWLPDEHAPAPFRVVGVPGTEDAVLVTQLPGVEPDRGGELVMRVVTSTMLARETVDLLPSVGPGGHPPVGASAVDLRNGSLPSDHPLRVLLAAPHPRLGQIAANHDHEGGHRRSSVIRWFDRPDDGRYLLLVTTDDQGEHLTICPADTDTLTAALARELDAVTKN